MPKKNPNRSSAARRREQRKREQKSGPAAPAINIGEEIADAIKSAIGSIDRDKNGTPVFILRASDNIAPLAIVEWLRLAIENRVPSEKIRKAENALLEIENWRKFNPLSCRLPD